MTIHLAAIVALLLVGGQSVEAPATSRRLALSSDASRFSAPSEGEGARGTELSLASPAYRRGFLLMPYGGMQYRFKGPTDRLWDCRPAVCRASQQERFQPAYRVGVIVGGHLTETWSLGGEFGFATWKLFENDVTVFPASVPGLRVYQFDFDATALHHYRWSRGDVVAGPKVGWSVLRGSIWPIDFHSSGPLVGARVGLLVAPAGWVSLGLFADLAYLHCLDTHNVLGFLAAAALF